jgi:hypothetical protein
MIDGMKRVIQFNWTLYAAAAFTIMLCKSLSFLPLPRMKFAITKSAQRYFDSWGKFFSRITVELSWWNI